MADILLLEDTLYDIYEQILGPSYPIVQADEGAPELDSKTSTYVVIEVEDLEQIGGAYSYNVYEKSDGNSYLKTKTEYTFQLIFTAHGPDADKVTRLISRSRTNTDNQYLLVDSQIALRQSSSIRRLPRIAGANIEKGSTITFEMGVADIVENEIFTINNTTVTGNVDNNVSDISVGFTTYFERYGYTIETVIKDYHSYSNSYNYVTDLGEYSEVIPNEFIKVNDGGEYPIVNTLP